MAFEMASRANGVRKRLAPWALLALCSTAVNAAPFGFRTQVNLAHGEALSIAVAIADFDGDGRDDLAAVTQGYLEVYLQRGDGSLAPAIEIAMPSSNFSAVKAGDLLSSGGHQLLVGHDHGLALYRWESGGFVLDDHPASYPCRTIATADIDMDGGNDVACVGDHGEVSLYSDPATSASAPAFMMTAAPGAQQAQLDDVTGDGKPDLLVASTYANSFFVYPNDGSGGLLPGIAYPYVQSAYLWSGAIEDLDIDGDGSREVVVATPCNSPCSSLYFYRHASNLYLTLSSSILTYDNPDALLAADLDHDGREDLLVGHGGWFAVGRYMGLGPGRGLSPELRSLADFKGTARGMAVGDLNHDGYTDLAFASGWGLSILYGGRPAANDFNGDFVSDLLWRHSSGSDAIWLSGNVATQQGMNPADPAWVIEGVADFDGDGLSDVFWRNRTTGADEIWAYGSQPKPVTAVTSQDWQVVGAGDFDGDGQADLFWRNARTGANVVWKSADAAQPQATTAVTDVRWTVVGVGYFDKDAQADVLWRHSTTGSNVIWRSGRSASQQSVTAVTNTDWKVVGLGDFDGDGRDDVVWRNARTGANTIWRAANANATQAVTGVTNLAWSIAAIGDYDGDGRSDLFWRNSANGTNSIWRAADATRILAVATLADTRWKPAP